MNDAISNTNGYPFTFGTGDASASISIAIDDDELYEGGASGTPEDIKFELSSLVNSVSRRKSKYDLLHS